MKSTTLRLLFVLSLLANVGVLGAFGYRALESGRWPGAGADAFPGLTKYLALDTQQQRRWQEAEEGFVERYAAGAAAIHEGRDRLIRLIFADSPDMAAIEAERAEIAQRQNEQQRIVIEQLLRERELLDAGQRARLAQLLLSQPVRGSGFEELHRD